MLMASILKQAMESEDEQQHLGVKKLQQAASADAVMLHSVQQLMDRRQNHLYHIKIVCRHSGTQRKCKTIEAFIAQI